VTTATQLDVDAEAGVWWLDLGSVNSYLAVDGDDLVLVDAGTPRSGAAIAEGIRDAGYEIGDVTRVLVTHFDLDHVGALSKLDLDAPVYAGRADAEVLAGQTDPDWRSRKGLLQRAVKPFVSAPGLPIRPVEDGDEIGGFTAYHTPGHSPGHVAYVASDGKKRNAGDDGGAEIASASAPSVGFLGDLVVESDGQLEPSPWVLSYDTDEVARSIRRLADAVPDFDVAAMGHGTPIMREGSQRLRELASRL
jgi:glyoxylase-like metal-dependent hydrolase (beta-lactamase superfamily II)